MPAVVTRLAVVVVACLLATATITFAANSGRPEPTPAPAPAAPAPPEELVVPDVRNQAYVFAKGALEDAGLAWEVVGPVEGYAANLVQTQSPAPGTRLVADGAPIVTLQLTRNAGYAQEGEPENASPYPGTTPRLASAKVDLVEPAPAPVAKPAQPAPAPAAKPAAAPEAPAAKAEAEKAAPAAKPEPAKAEKPAAETTPEPAKAEKPGAKAASKREPAFVVPGAPPEPLDEISLPDRAAELYAWLSKHPKPTDENVRHWLYQHEWIVSGAKFGWHGGEAALVKLIEVDRKAEELWGIGTKSRTIAEAALAEVRSRTR